jgi:hypothetical protein
MDALELAGSGGRVGVLDIAEEALQGVVAVECVGPVQFHGVASAGGGELMPGVLGAYQNAVARQALVQEVHGVVGDAGGFLEPCLHGAEAVADDREVGKVGAVARPRLQPGGGGGDEGFVQAEAEGGEIGTPVDDAAALRHVKTLTQVAEHRCSGHAYPVEDEVAGAEAVQAQAGPVRGQTHPLAVVLDEKRGQRPGGGCVGGGGAGDDDVQAGEVAVRAPSSRCPH